MADGSVDRNKIKNNGWRLGCCFDKTSAPELVELIPNEHQADDAIYIVATHDCSLIHPKLEREPYLEYFAAFPLSKANAQNTEAKDIRCLHLPVLVNESEQPFELQMARRGFIDRSPIEQCKPCSQATLPADSLAILTRWLVNRYSTQTLPDAFDQRIKPLVEGKKKPLRKLLQRPEASAMLGIYIDLEPPGGDLPIDQAYQLTLLLLYKDEGLPVEADLDLYADEIKQCLERAEGVEIKGIVALSDKDITVYRLRRMRRWQLDFISFRDEADEVALISEDLL